MGAYLSKQKSLLKNVKFEYNNVKVKKNMKNEKKEKNEEKDKNEEKEKKREREKKYQENAFQFINQYNQRLNDMERKTIEHLNLYTYILQYNEYKEYKTHQKEIISRIEQIRNILWNTYVTRERLTIIYEKNNQILCDIATLFDDIQFKCDTFREKISKPLDIKEINKLKKIPYFTNEQIKNDFIYLNGNVTIEMCHHIADELDEVMKDRMNILSFPSNVVFISIIVQLLAYNNHPVSHHSLLNAYKECEKARHCVHKNDIVKSIQMIKQKLLKI